MTEEAVSNTLPIGSLLHWYEVQDVLGRGGYGITYLAFDQNLHRKVAIKEYLPTDFAHRVSNTTVRPLSESQRDLYSWGLERFLSEARTLAKFNHKAIIKVNSVFEQNNTAYMVMEYEEGDDLSVVFEKYKPFTQEQLLKLFLPIVEGLALVHEAGFIHRDIKPANIYVRKDGSPVLLDFGSARQTLRSQTTALTTLVTTGYAPFEQYNQSDDEQGVWTDIYALGCTLYYCITGDKPVDALKRSAALLKQGRDVYEPISSVQIPGFTQNFLRAIDHALMFHAERRPHSARYWADMLTGKVAVAPVTADLFTLNNPSDAHYDLDSTVVMMPVRTAPPQNVQPKAWENSRQPDRSSFEEEPDRTVVQTPGLPGHRTEQGVRSASGAPPIQSVSSQQLDQITEALARPRNPAPVRRVAEKMRGTLTERLRQNSAQLWELLAHTAGSLISVRDALAKHLWQNQSVLFGATTVVVLLGAGILLTALLGGADPDATPAQADAQAASAAEEQNAVIAAAAMAQPVAADPIEQLLQQAQLEQAEGRLVEETGTGAYYSYLKVLELEPQQPTATQQLGIIRQHYSQQVAERLQANDWTQAQADLAKYKLIADDLNQLEQYERQFAQREAKLRNLDSLLAQADQLFAQNKLTKPESKSALAFYNQALRMDPDNQAAKQGISNIVEKLGEQLQKQLTIETIKSAETTFNKIAEIDASATILADTEPVIAKLLAQRQEIYKLLGQAKADFIRGDIISPKGDNALEKYRSVIDIDPNHSKAKEGIETIYQYYVSDFNRYLEEKRFDKADSTLNKLSNADFDRQRIVNLRQRLAKARGG